MKYRNLSKIDSEKFWQLMNQLDYETKYMLYGPGERKKNIPKIESLIQNSVDGEDFLLVAEADNRIVGYISAEKELEQSFLNDWILGQMKKRLPV